MNDLSFRLPDNFPSARSLLLIATSAPLMIINLRFADRHIPVFMPPNYPFHGLTRAMLLEEISPDHHPGFRSPRGPGRLPFFHETGSRSGADWRNTAATTSVMLRDGQLFSFHAYLTDRVFERIIGAI